MSGFHLYHKIWYKHHLTRQEAFAGGRRPWTPEEHSANNWLKAYGPVVKQFKEDLAQRSDLIKVARLAKGVTVNGTGKVLYGEYQISGTPIVFFIPLGVDIDEDIHADL